MNLSDDKIADILVEQAFVSREVINKISSKAKKTGLVNTLYDEGLLNKDLLGQAIAEYFNVPYSDLNSYEPEREQVLLIPESVAKRFNIVLFKENDEKIVIATDNPAARGLNVELQKIFGNKKKIEITYSLEEDILNTFIYYQEPLDTRFKELLRTDSSAAPQIVEEIFRDAIIYKATDIHFEPEQSEVVIRFRVDGLLYEAGRLEKKYYNNIVNRIKVLASLKIDEHFKAQDGAIRFDLDSRSIDLRISIVPVIEGEKIVIRILAEYIKSFSLTDIGLSERDKVKVMSSINKPVGMIIIAGPTGSGKTTSLYSFLRTLNNPTRNITTIEDPVEYRIPGINQIQVDKHNNISFSNGLRSVVRQDPDIILVGEIRDEETAELSVNAALTGHLLLSTFHANNSATVIPRLLDMGIEPFLLASTIELIVSQRLVRKLCESCRKSQKISDKEFKKQIPGATKIIGPKKSINIYKSEGCSSCNGTGYKGRTSVFEIIKVTKEVKDLILKNPSSDEVWKLAKKQGSNSMFDDGVQKILQGVTSIDELKRIAPPDED